MDAEDLIFECFPKAEAREEPAIFEHGVDAPIQGGYWAIFAGPDFDSNEIGRGSSEARAWSDAADHLNNQPA
jgi:hypothetical protein